jgi:acyl-coenzyme A synthetase/AMP-(fatty) acid ligase
LARPGFADPDAVMRLIYSSGTTGHPKCVGLTSRTLELRVARSEMQMPNRAAGGAQLNTQAFSTIMGTVMAFQAPTSGVLLCHATSGGEALQMVRAFGVSFLACSVGQLQGIMKALGDASPPPTLKAVLAMGAPMSRAQLTDVRARLCSHVMGMYGSTEMGRVAYAEPRDLERDEGSVGLPVPFMEVEVVDADGRAVAAGRDGTLRVRSDALAVYVDEAGRASSCAAEDGWFYPGDRGRLEADGQLLVTGRTSEVLNRGGVIVAPEAIEAVLRGFDGVEEVAVVGVPTVAGVDEIWAAVVPSKRIDAQGMLGAARAQLGERAPDRLFQVGRLPRTQNGKVRRGALRDELLELSKAR